MSRSLTNYAEWAAETFEARVAPLLAPVRGELLPGVTAGLWLDTCLPGPTPETRFRLFPGSFFLLWVEALGGAEARRGAEPVAAAIELLHNASLVHDDVIDGHSVRKGQPTLRALCGSAVALLGGDGLMAAAFSVLGEVADARLPGCLRRLGLAAHEVVAGQVLDEPERWARVPVEDRWGYWLTVCRGKLALGNVGGPLAAFWAGRRELEAPLGEMLTDYSVVSQVINDFGDLLDFAGYQVAAPSARPAHEESARKPTLPLVWAGCEDVAGLTEMPQLWRRAGREIEERKARALARLRALPLGEDGRGLLQDFFLRPALPAGGRSGPQP
jgi:hypothetical protein